MTAVVKEEPTSTVIDVPEYIDRQPVGAFQIRLLLICAAVLFIDGFDTQAIGYVAPAVAQEWKLPRGALGPVFSAGLFGLMIGALVFGTLADRIGRKRIIVLSTAAFGVGTLLTILVQDAAWLMALRFLTGRRYVADGLGVEAVDKENRRTDQQWRWVDCSQPR
jgi:MFS transporter, AAHS family, 4-hydroxybenzoate transporter